MARQINPQQSRISASLQPPYLSVAFDAAQQCPSGVHTTEDFMIRTVKISVVAILIAATTVPFLPMASNARPYDDGAYWHRHDDKGW
jgi:hypothetical protein